MKYIIVLFIVLVGSTLSAQTKDPHLLTVGNFEATLKAKEETAQLIDVRSPSEFADGHLKRALNLNLADDNFEELVQKRLDKNKPVFLYCFSGKRSGDAAVFMRNLGFKEVYDMQGGFAQWTASSKPYVSTNPNTRPIAALTLANLDEIVRANDIVFISFYTEWCEPCKKTSPLLNKMANENKHIKLIKIDSEKNDILASVFKIEDTPAYVIIKKGKRTWSSTGEISEAELKDILQKIAAL